MFCMCFFFLLWELWQWQLKFLSGYDYIYARLLWRGGGCCAHIVARNRLPYSGLPFSDDAMVTRHAGRRALSAFCSALSSLIENWSLTLSPLLPASHIQWQGWKEAFPFSCLMQGLAIIIKELPVWLKAWKSGPGRRVLRGLLSQGFQPPMPPRWYLGTWKTDSYWQAKAATWNLSKSVSFCQPLTA